MVIVVKKASIDLLFYRKLKIFGSAAKTTHGTNRTKCTTEKIRAICEIRGCFYFL